MNCTLCGSPVNVEEIETGVAGTKKVAVFMCLNCDFTESTREDIINKGYTPPRDPDQ